MSDFQFQVIVVGLGILNLFICVGFIIAHYILKHNKIETLEKTRLFFIFFYSGFLFYLFSAYIMGAQSYKEAFITWVCVYFGIGIFCGLMAVMIRKYF